MQKMASGAMGAPQDMQNLAGACIAGASCRGAGSASLQPQLLQKSIPGRILVPQRGHFSESLSAF
jgi:hypothetical protein